MDCQGCGDKIPSRAVVNGKLRKVFWKRKWCFKCSPFGEMGARVRRKKWPGNMKVCPGCGAKAHVRVFKRNAICNDCLAKRAKVARHKLKQLCVDYLGGKCKQCGYNKCLAALDFHHRDPNEKDFEIGRAKGRAKSFEEMKSELDKCDLLCRNCHAEAHFNSSK
jgi:hypothetical protein